MINYAAQISRSPAYIACIRIAAEEHELAEITIRYPPIKCKNPDCFAKVLNAVKERVWKKIVNRLASWVRCQSRTEVVSGSYGSTMPMYFDADTRIREQKILRHMNQYCLRYSKSQALQDKPRKQFIHQDASPLGVLLKFRNVVHAIIAFEEMCLATPPHSADEPRCSHYSGLQTVTHRSTEYF